MQKRRTCGGAPERDGGGGYNQQIKSHQSDRWNDTNQKYIHEVLDNKNDEISMSSDANGDLSEKEARNYTNLPLGGGGCESLLEAPFFRFFSAFKARNWRSKRWTYKENEKRWMRRFYKFRTDDKETMLNLKINVTDCNSNLLHHQSLHHRLLQSFSSSTQTIW